jgi:hypothetical protein
MVGSFAVKTVVLGPPPKELKELIQRRRALGLDRFDEVWEGSYHVAPMARWRHGYLAAAVLIPGGGCDRDRWLQPRPTRQLQSP